MIYEVFYVLFQKQDNPKVKLKDNISISMKNTSLVLCYLVSLSESLSQNISFISTYHIGKYTMRKYLRSLENCTMIWIETKEYGEGTSRHWWSQSHCKKHTIKLVTIYWGWFQKTYKKINNNVNYVKNISFSKFHINHISQSLKKI